MAESEKPVEGPGTDSSFRDAGKGDQTVETGTDGWCAGFGLEHSDFEDSRLCIPLGWRLRALSHLSKPIGWTHSAG